MNSQQSEEREKALMNIKQTAIEMAEQTSSFVDLYHNRSASMERVNVIECINKAIAKANYKELPEIEVVILTENIYLYANENKITEMVYNIISNSIEAISDAKRKGGYIKIKVFDEYNLLCISIYDNGCGMTKEIRKNLFKPLISTKKTFYHWGLGMSQVYNTVESLGGFINVKSKLNEFTEIQMVFKKIK